MQNINIIYGKFSPLFLIPHKEWFSSSKILHEALEFTLNHGVSDINDFDSEIVYYPIQSDFNNPYFYYILYNLSRFFKVKVMWNDYIDRDDLSKINKGFKVFGNVNTIVIFSVIIIKFFGKSHRHKSWYLDNTERLVGYKNIRTQYKEELNHFYDLVNKTIEGLLPKEDNTYNYRLENWIMGVEKLNYKSYKGNNLYQHAISKNYQHKRMLL